MTPENQQKKLDSRQEKRKKSKDERQSPTINDLVLVEKESGNGVEYQPKNTKNSIKYMNIAFNEIQQIEMGSKKLSDLEKNRIALKFIEMNSSPKKF